jgi:hypothetical protein
LELLLLMMTLLLLLLVVVLDVRWWGAGVVQVQVLLQV